jgi:peptide/nickel transport system permease protein
MSNAALAIPGLLLAMILIAGMGPGITTIVLAVGLGGVPGFTRMSRAVFRELTEAGYVLAAQAVGTSQIRIIRSHIFPNSLRKLAPVGTINFAWAILGITTLTFLGLAGDPSIPEWGVMLNDGRGYLFEAPWLVLLPGILISTTVIVVHALGKRIGEP